MPVPIPDAYAQRKVYHFTPAANLPDILAHGLLSVSEQKRQGLPLRTIVWDAVLRHRSALAVPLAPNGTPDDYVPFYFCRLSPMLLAVMSSKAVDEEQIIHFEFPIEVMASHQALFTDAAILPNSTPNFYADPADLARLDWDSIDSPQWRMPTESLRQARLSELLIWRSLPVISATRLIVWDSAMAGQVLQVYQSFGITPPLIQTDPSCYFIDPESPQPKPAIRGPSLIYQAYENTIQQLSVELNHPKQPRFSDLAALRAGLRKDMGCLPETAELVGLETDNRAHFEDVGAHTRRVVKETMHAPEYARLDAHDQLLLEIAAFLHDIGKGPRQRWEAFGNKQQLDPDHPVKALPMVRRILTEDVAHIDYADAVLLCKLVAYHDIIGGILFSGRRLSELLNVFENEREFNMVMGLGRADSLAINPSWDHTSLRDELRATVLPKLSHSRPG